jgi:glycosyltransferase involved in cell wall biosynthesis
MLNLKDISRLAQNKKIFVTLHDERFYTGGCHYTCGCERYRNGCFKCPQVKSLAHRFPAASIKSAGSAWHETQGVTFIAPSKWLAEKAQKSPLIEKSNVEFISNPVPSEFFVSRDTPANPDSINQNVLTVGFISENLNNPYKGIEILRNALMLIGDKRAIKLKLFGSGSPGKFPSNTSVETRKFGNSNDAQKAISECDLIVVPSKQDNSPSVIAESLMCGVPVLGSRTGGITETLQEFGLPTFESENVFDLATQISHFTPMKLPREVMNRVNEKYSYETSASKHRQLYEK